ncbi:MAG: murein hydrolase activator EnvC family protein [Coriobacteriia bacterium]
MWRVIVALCVVSLLLVVVGQSAWAAEWSPPVSGASIALPFGAEYPGGVHRGIDLPADAGVAVRSPMAGRIAFAGTIPADGGGTCNAVTIETTDGRRVSLLPLESVHIQAGASVCAGDTVGRLAASGDDSLGYPHLHLGLRQGDRYIDPAPMLSIGGGGEPAMPPVLYSSPEPPLVPADTALPHGSDTASGELTHGSVSVPLPVPATASASAQIPSESMTAPRPMSADPEVSPRSSSGGAPTRATAAMLTAPVTAPAARLMRDAGASASGDLPSVQAGVDSGGTTWISKRTGGVLAPVARTPVAYALVALVTATGAVMPIIARSKALVRAR